MKAAPAKDKKTIIVVSVFGALLLLFVLYAYNAFFGGTSNPAAVQPPVAVNTPAESGPTSPVRSRSSSRSGGSGAAGMGVAPGIAATKMARTSASLDPTLHESAMLRTESLVYSGTGRNIFSATYTPPVVIPKNVPSARPSAAAIAAAAAAASAPPPPPPIDLKFFGDAIRANGLRQAFLLHGDDVYLASTGDIVARKYKIISIGTTSIQVEDLQDNNTQSLPLQQR
ncbi:MAG: hypothetical protein HIU91_02880 [Acidobacteria bacterium]|nr:hypothetical protein [Acidobacteriota bacterium]